MDQFNVFTKEFKSMKENLFNDFKDDVLYPDYEDTNFHERISKKFDDEQRRKIFNPVLSLISKSKGYKISITDHEFKEKIKEFKAPSDIIKQTLAPLEKKKETNIDLETSLTRKIEQSYGNKTKTIFAENIQYLEQNYILTSLEYDSKKLYFNESHTILLIFQNNYYKIDDDTYQIYVSNPDLHGLLESYNKVFISEFKNLIANKDNLSDEHNELLTIYENSTMRDW